MQQRSSICHQRQSSDAGRCCQQGVLATIDVHCSPCGRFLYASNTAYNTIAIFRIDQATGALTLAGHQPTLGQTPRQFSLSPGKPHDHCWH